MTLADRTTDLRATTAAAEPLADPIATFVGAHAQGLDASLWLQPDRGLAIVGIGRAWSVEAAGPGRFGVAAGRWRALAGDLLARDPGARPILLGGLGFTGGVPADGDVWAPFGPSSLVLHELTWVARAGEGTLTTVGVGTPGRDRPVAADPDPDAVAGPAPLSIVGGRPDRATWDRLVAMFAGAVGRGRLDKVVLGRRVDVVGGDAAPLSIGAALRHLEATAPESTIYAFGRGGTGSPVFLGATPERLVRTEEGRFRTVALAGSAPRSADPEEDARFATALLASEKDREEHAVVVAMLRESLGPIVTELDVEPTPRLLELRHVRHLQTLVRGRLRDDAGLLALAERLHPTPAVGGEPRALALELIAEHEGFDRGWYAGPIGWVDAGGDGELCVALRCGVVGGARASLFAGCGIVADSDPAREWEESRIKLRAVGNALGGIADGPGAGAGEAAR